MINRCDKERERNIIFMKKAEKNAFQIEQMNIKQKKIKTILDNHEESFDKLIESLRKKKHLNLI